MAAPLVIRAATALVGRRLVDAIRVVIDGGTIIEVGPSRRGHADADLATGILAPGLIDLQCNGAFGIDVAGGNPAKWARLLGRLPATGVTTVLPTAISAPVDNLTGSWPASALVRPTTSRRLGRPACTSRDPSWRRPDGASIRMGRCATPLPRAWTP